MLKEYERSLSFPSFYALPPLKQMLDVQLDSNPHGGTTQTRVGSGVVFFKPFYEVPDLLTNYCRHKSHRNIENLHPDQYMEERNLLE